MSLFDEQNLAEITRPHYPHERLIACRNPCGAYLAVARQASTRGSPLTAPTV